MTNVFISYRHGDTLAAAAHLHEALPRHLPDVRDLPGRCLAPSGRRVDARAAPDDAVGRLVPRPHRAQLARARLEGRLRLDDRADVVRLEISTAITLGIPVLPVTVEGAEMPPTAILPLSVARLVRFQRATLSTADPAGDVGRIASVLREQRRSGRRTPIPPELTGFWSRTTATSGSSYEFRSDGTYVQSGMLLQPRPTGPYTFEVFEEGLADVEPGVLHLEPLRASATQRDAGRPETDYTESPRELVGKTLFWRLRPASPALLLLRPPGEAETAYELEWRAAAEGDPAALRD